MMQLVYVDRVVNMRSRDVRRTFPTLIGWNDQQIRNREKFEMKRGSFGIGNIEERMKVLEDDEFAEEEGADGDNQGGDGEPVAEVPEVERSVHTQAGPKEVHIRQFQYYILYF